MPIEEAENPGLDRRKPRACLSCHETFDSEWAGERICRRCKGTSTWRGGLSKASANHGQYQARSHRKGAS